MTERKLSGRQLQDSAMVGFRGHWWNICDLPSKVGTDVATKYWYLHSHPRFRQQLMLVAGPSRDGRAMGDYDQPTGL